MDITRDRKEELWLTTDSFVLPVDSYFKHKIVLMMASYLENINIFNLGDIMKPDIVMEILVDFGLFPKKYPTPPCKVCNGQMFVNEDKTRKVDWRWKCSAKDCRATINPLENTFFENVKISFMDVFMIIVSFAWGIEITTALKDINDFRKTRNEKVMSTNTINDFYSYLREVSEVFVSNNIQIIGGEGKTVSVDETFLTRRKYNRGRITSQMSQVVLGIYCREDKEGLFFLVDGKSKADLWPYIHKYVHQKTKIICTDSALQYHSVSKMFLNAIHKTTNHSIGEFVNKTDKSNTINDLENENKHLKRALIVRKTDESILQYMAYHQHKRKRMHKKFPKSVQLRNLLVDIAAVYPGYGKEGLKLVNIDKPTPESEGILHLMPKAKKPRISGSTSEESSE